MDSLVGGEAPNNIGQPALEPQEALHKIEIIIGAAASAITGAPEYNLSKLRDLLQCLNKIELGPFNGREHKNTVLGLHRLIARASTRIYENIIPNYRIRQNQSEENASVKLSKEVIKIRQYEKTFSSIYKNHYLDYLKRMLDCVKKKPSSTFYTNLIETNAEDRELLAETAVECYGRILAAHPHFNYRDQIIQNLVHYNAQTRHRKCAELAHHYLSKALRADKLGEVSLEITSAICDITKKLRLSLSASLFQTLLNLKLIDVKQADQDAKEKAKAERQKVAELKKKQSRKERKRQKKMKKLKNELLEAEAHVTVDQKLKYHKTILKKLFVTYFRLLRYHEELMGEKGETKKFVKLLPPVLEGISKFAHLIDIDICNDMFPLIKMLLENTTVTTNCKLHCLSTVFVLYKTLESELSRVDPDGFYRDFYYILENLNAHSMNQTELTSLINCIHLMLIKRAKQVTVSRFCAFVRRLLILALNIPPAFAPQLLETIRIMFLQRPQVKALLDSANCRDYGSGQFDMDVSDPDHCHADSSVAWEMHLLLEHVDSKVRDSANMIKVT